MRPPHKIVDLFAGPGGLDIAARWLDIPVVGIELDEEACKTRLAEGLETRECDVRDRKPSEFEDATVLTGGPPCQTYTVAGQGAGRRALEDVLRFADKMADGEDVTAELTGLDDPRTGLVLEPLRWVLEAKKNRHPYQVIVLEQVPAVLPVWKAMKRILEKLGYSAECDVLNAEEYGVPQTRRRAVLVARLGDVASLPKATHRRFHKSMPRTAGDQTKLPWVPMGDVLERLEPFKVVSNYGTGGNPKARGIRTSDEPAFTVTGKILRNRVMTRDDQEADPARFTHAESGCLQTFPLDYRWRGRDIAQQIGNAVPPRLAAYVLAAALKLGDDPLRKIFPDLAKLDGISTDEQPGQLGVF
ncbi:DNA cytosine methyltransferase [Streptosporangium sp. V21-05]|uniref:DNA cytosine methyltransferase n=1 Tax=Streptosporangium sp. V21-05 TaxID=3446115 RepID=UPI003F539481